jgi:flagellar hook assembly protein FlgD
VDPPVAGSDVQLGAPSPNPVNDALHYSVSLDRASRVQVELFAPNGRLVRTLEDREMPAGLNRLSWDSRAGGGVPLGSGVYYLRLTAGGVQRSRTLSIIR